MVLKYTNKHLTYFLVGGINFKMGLRRKFLEIRNELPEKGDRM